MAPHDLRLARRVAAGDLRGAASLLRQGLSPDESWLRGAPCTVLAARLDHDRLLGLVLNNGEEKDLADGDGMTALAVSASRGSTACVRLLLARRADVDCRDLSLRSPLQHAAQAGHQAAVVLLIEGGANINAQDERGVSALMAACDIGHVKVVDNLLRHGAEPDLRDRQGVTALLRAAQFVHAAARKLPDLRGPGEAGGSAADDNDDDNGNDCPPTEPPSPPRLNGPFPPGTPARLLPFMPRRGAASSQPTEAGIPDDEASARASREAMVCALLAKRAATDVRASGSGLTALMAGAREGHLEVVMPLLKAGAALDLRAHGGVAERPDVGSRVPPSAMYGGPSALALAAAHGHSRIVEALLARGARSDERDAEGFTVLWQASARNHVRATHVLQERGGLKELRTWADPSERRQVARTRAAAQEERWAVEAEAEAEAAAAAGERGDWVMTAALCVCGLDEVAPSGGA
jgi:ankyrin repeat protein